MKSEFPRLSANTIRVWSKTEDENGLTWYQKREEQEKIKLKRIEAHALSERGKIKIRNATIMDALYSQLINEAGEAILKAKDLIQGIYALRDLSKFHLALDDQEKQNFDPFWCVQLIVETLYSFPGVSKELGKVWPEFQKQLTIRFNKQLNFIDITDTSKEIKSDKLVEENSDASK
ncbi:hypothetical protein [Leptospira santarosai]|uniref:hypothetical protein n=1 Tax=Leptospira santarosai TaxID=28183 RepID=UPI001E63604A|nr:hypothetical protein [Leptospira santarosai]